MSINNLTRCIFLFFILLLSDPAIALNTNIDGTWQLVSATRTILKDGNTKYPYGKNPEGYLIYLPNGYMSVVIINKDLTKSLNSSSMLSYAGTYTVTKNQVIHHIQSAWKPSWIGTNQVRHYNLQDNKLILSFYDHDTQSDYKSILIWERR